MTDFQNIKALKKNPNKPLFFLLVLSILRAIGIIFLNQHTRHKLYLLRKWHLPSSDGSE